MIPIKIFVMSYNDASSLKLCIQAIKARTLYAYEIIIVDNASTDNDTLVALKHFSDNDKITVYRNTKNQWILGLNRPLRNELSQERDAFFVVTDCDIIPPVPHNNICWLERLIAYMNTYACVGKIGLALDVGYLETRSQFAKTLRREKAIQNGPRIGDLVIAPVDTTMALYRYDVFVTARPWFMPGHQSLYRPYYYCCRTPLSLRCKHIGWRNYARQSPQDLHAKFVTFGLLGAYIDPNLYQQAALRTRFLFRLLQPIARLGWGILVSLLILYYVVRHFPRSLNVLQSSQRT